MVLVGFGWFWLVLVVLVSFGWFWLVLVGLEWSCASGPKGEVADRGHLNSPRYYYISLILLTKALLKNVLIELKRKYKKYLSTLILMKV